MLVIYNIGIRLYYLAVYIASFFNVKAKLWISGRKDQSVKPLDSCTWFHFASLGEFEQGRPVLEALKVKEPGVKVVITFFSPSGFEVRKNTDLAEAVYYLPLDTAENAQMFISSINPTRAIFTKYEYWFHFFNELYNRHIPLYIISGIFRPGQVFFKRYGGLHRKMLKMVTRFFLQDKFSVNLLKNIGIANATVSGDTRFDRVYANAVNPKDIHQIKLFTNNMPVFIAGSTWPNDEKLLLQLINTYPEQKFIIAPHEIGKQRLDDLLKLLPASKTILFSQLGNLSSTASVLVIDNIGMLSSLYQYGSIAYIGGGFGRGIHNVLEAAAFGLPVVFGPNYTAFKEAKDLIALKAAFTISNSRELKNAVEPLLKDKSNREITGQKAKSYIKDNIGATAIIINAIVWQTT